MRALTLVVLLGAAAQGLAACSDARRLATRNPLDLITQDALAEVKQPLLFASLDALGASATLAISGRNGDVTTWRAADGVALSLRGGVLVATRGLGNDLMSADAGGTRAMLQGGGGAGYYPRFHSYLDGEDQTAFRAFQCRETGRRAEQIAIAGRNWATLRISETCVSRGLKIENTFWRSGGLTVRSRQWVSQSAGYVETQRLVP